MLSIRNNLDLMERYIRTLKSKVQAHFVIESLLNGKYGICSLIYSKNFFDDWELVKNKEAIEFYARLSTIKGQLGASLNRLGKDNKNQEFHISMRICEILRILPIYHDRN